MQVSLPEGLIKFGVESKVAVIGSILGYEDESDRCRVIGYGVNRPFSITLFSPRYLFYDFSRTSKCEKRSTKISFTAMNEVQEYEKQSAIDEDEKLKMSRNNSKISLIDQKRSNSKFKQLANRVSQTIAGERLENNVIPMKS